MAVPFVDLRAQHASIRDDVRAAIDRVVESQAFILGPEVEAFEREAATFAGSRHAIGVSSGTDALLVALMAAGVGPGDEVVTTPFTFLATAMTIARLGARAVFVDLEPGGFLLDPTRVKVTPATRAIVPVHLFGEVVDVSSIRASALGVPVIEDAAQAFGATRDGRAAGTLGALGCLSFFPTKNLGAFGDAGMVLTDDDALAATVRRLRVQGQSARYVAEAVGGNFRLDALQAAILRVKLRHLRAWTAARAARARVYRSALGDLGERLTLPDDREGHAWHHYVVRTAHRDALRAHLAERGIGSEVYYPLPLHLQPAFASWGYRRGDLPNAERAADEALALPLRPELDESAQGEVITAVRDFFARGPA